MDWVANPNSSLPIVWVDRSLDFGTPFDPFSSTFLIDESIMESMMPEGEPWEDRHHRSHLQDYEQDEGVDIPF